MPGKGRLAAAPRSGPFEGPFCLMIYFQVATRPRCVRPRRTIYSWLPSGDFPCLSSQIELDSLVRPSRWPVHPSFSSLPFGSHRFWFGCCRLRAWPSCGLPEASTSGKGHKRPRRTEAANFYFMLLFRESRSFLAGHFCAFVCLSWPASKQAQAGL